MVNRLVVSATDQPRTREFAFSKRLAQFYVGTYTRAGAVTTLTHSNNQKYTDWNANTTPDPIIWRLLDLASVDNVEIVGHSQIRVTLLPVFDWSDKDDGISIFDHIVQSITQLHMKEAEVEVIVTENIGGSDITVFKGPSTTNLFVLSRVIARGAGDFVISKNSSGVITADDEADERAAALGRAILLYPLLVRVRVTGQHVRVDAGTFDSAGEKPAVVTADARAYAVAAIRAVMYPGESPAVRVSNVQE